MVFSDNPLARSRMVALARVVVGAAEVGAGAAVETDADTLVETEDAADEIGEAEGTEEGSGEAFFSSGAFARVSCGAAGTFRDSK